MLKRGIFLLLTLTLTLLLSIATQAVDCTNGGWCEYGYDLQNTRYNPLVSGVWLEAEGFGSTYAITSGSFFAPIISDIDGDGKTDYLVADSNILSVYNREGQIFTIKDQIGMNNPQAGSATIFDHDGDGNYTILIPTTNDLEIFGFQNGVLVNHSKHTVPSAIRSAIGCDPLGNCYMTSKNSYLHKYVISTDVFSTQNLGLNYFGDQNHARRIAPVMLDENLDGSYESVYHVARKSSDPKIEGIIKTSESLTVFTSWGGSVNGFRQMPLNTGDGETSVTVTGFLGTDLDNNGAVDLFATYRTDGALNDQNAGLFHIENGGSGYGISFASTEFCSADNIPNSLGCFATAPFAVDIDNDGDQDVCAMATMHDDDTVPSTNSFFICVQDNFLGIGLSTSAYHKEIDIGKTNANSISFVDVGRDANTKQSTYVTVSVAEMDGTQEPEFAIADRLVLSIDTPVVPTSGEDWEDISTEVDFSTVLGTSNQLNAITDYNDDGIADVMYQGVGFSRIFFSSVQNEIPDINGNYAKNLNFPLCPGSTVTFAASECFLGSTLNCIYENDITTDTERLLSTCGLNSSTIIDQTDPNTVIGTYSASNPQISCTFDTLGTYSFNIYIQDSSNSEDLTQFRPVVVSVVNGTQGQTCDIPCIGTACSQIYDGQGSANQTTGIIYDPNSQEAVIQETINQITFGNAYIKMFFSALIIMIVLIWCITQGIQNPFVYALACTVTAFVLSILTFLPWTITIAFSLTVILIAVLVLALLGGGGSG